MHIHTSHTHTYTHWKHTHASMRVARVHGVYKWHLSRAPSHLRPLRSFPSVSVYTHLHIVCVCCTRCIIFKESTTVNKRYYKYTHSQVYISPYMYIQCARSSNIFFLITRPIRLLLSLLLPIVNGISEATVRSQWPSPVTTLWWRQIEF